jgi:hypothetical protein
LYSTSPASVPEKDINEQGSLAGLPGKKKKRKEEVNSPLESKCFAASYNGSKKCDSNG